MLFRSDSDLKECLLPFRGKRNGIRFLEWISLPKNFAPIWEVTQSISGFSKHNSRRVLISGATQGCYHCGLLGDSIKILS